MKAIEVSAFCKHYRTCIDASHDKDAKFAKEPNDRDRKRLSDQVNIQSSHPITKHLSFQQKDLGPGCRDGIRTATDVSVFSRGRRH